MVALLLSVTLTAMPQAPSLEDRRRTLEAELRQQPESVATLLALGDVHLAWPVVGRYRAWELYGKAAALAPHDPEPPYRRMLVGRHLGGDDGERMMRDAIFSVLALRSDYRDIWRQWALLYHGDGHRRRAIELLARYDDPASARRTAWLRIELDDYRQALRLLDSAEARWPDDPAFPALAAQALFERGNTPAGRRAYARAVALSAADTAHVLWRQIETIATPAEEGRYRTTPPGERPAFFRGFWGPRDPDLFTSDNERQAEHFARLRVARDQYIILHPQTMFHRSARWRTLMGAFAGDVAATPARAGFGFETLNRRSIFEEDLSRAGLGIDVRDLPEPASTTRYQRHGFDGRGLVYLRFGEPERIYRDVDGMEVETWAYRINGERIALTFARATAGASFRGASMAGGDFVVYPTNAVELHNAASMLERDATSVPAPIQLHAWVAAFRGAPSGWQDVYVAADADAAAVAAWDRAGTEVGRRDGASPVVLALPAGDYRFQVHGRRGDALGRAGGTMVVPRLGGWLSISSLLAAVGTDSGRTRDDFARAMPPDLVLERNGRPISLYAEIYDLPARDSAVTYRVTWTFESGHAERIAFAFDRRRSAASVIAERLTLQPGHIPRGTYRVTVRVEDRVLGLRTATTRVDVELR